MPLSDTAIRNAKPGVNPKGNATTKPYKMPDAGGLYIEVAPSGGKWWRFKYRFEGKEKRISLGVYPAVPLASRTEKDKGTGKARKIKGARELCAEARELLASGVDPSANKKAAKAAQGERAANSFEIVAREWFDKHAPNWKENHSSKIIRRLEVDIFPWLGAYPVGDIAAPLKAGARWKQRTEPLPIADRYSAMPLQQAGHYATQLRTCADHCRL
jgi:hypothetical protein